MKLIIKTAVALLFFMLSISTSWAEEHPMPAMPMHHGMGMWDSMTEAEQDQHRRAMQEHQLQMHDLSNKILAEKDPAKKEQLKNQQLQLMKDHHAKMMAVHHPKK